VAFGLQRANIPG